MALEKVKIRIDWTKNGSDQYIEMSIDDLEDFYEVQRMMEIICIKRSEFAKTDEKLRGE